MNTMKAKQLLCDEQTGKCAGCAMRFEAQHLEVDHIISKSKGGGDTLENYQLLCCACNRIKHGRAMEYLLDHLRTKSALPAM